jgi:probable phosphoglycerate mutase
MSQTQLILIRHGETAWNLEHRMQGHLDSPLTDNGIAQAKALAQRLRNQSFSALYSSDLGRAYQTAQCIAETTGLTIQIKPELRERNLGNFQGLTRQEVGQLYPQEYSSFQAVDPDYVIPNGESLKQFRQRCTTSLEQLAVQHAGEKILIVTHGGVLVNFFKYILGLPYQTPRCFDISNTGINIFSYRDNQWVLTTWGDISHYQQIDFLVDDF